MKIDKIFVFHTVSVSIEYDLTSKKNIANVNGSLFGLNKTFHRIVCDILSNASTRVMFDVCVCVCLSVLAPNFQSSIVSEFNSNKTLN